MGVIETWVFLGLVAWVATGVMALIEKVLEVRAGRERRKLMLKCEIYDCDGPADVVLVFEDAIRGMCVPHFKEEQETIDGKAGEEGDESHRTDPRGDEPDGRGGRD